MTAVVSREHAKATWLTGAAGLVILAAAVVMMACAAPSLARPRPYRAVPPSASVSVSSLTTGTLFANWAGWVGQGRRAAEQTW